MAENPVEQDHHKRAFELYNAQGHKRTYQTVAKQMGVSLRSIKNWAAQFRWRERVAERDASVARQIADQALTDGVAERTRHIKIVQMAIVRLARAINDGKVRMQMGDLDRLIHLKGYLEGLDDNDPVGKSPEQLGRFLAERLDMMSCQDHDRLRLAWEARTKEIEEARGEAKVPAEHRP